MMPEHAKAAGQVPWHRGGAGLTQAREVELQALNDHGGAVVERKIPVMLWIRAVDESQKRNVAALCPQLARGLVSQGTVATPTAQMVRTGRFQLADALRDLRGEILQTAWERKLRGIDQAQVQAQKTKTAANQAREGKKRGACAET